MKKALHQELRFRLLKGPRSSAPHSPACRPRPALPRPTRSPRSSSVHTASRAGRAGSTSPEVTYVVRRRCRWCVARLGLRVEWGLRPERQRYVDRNRVLRVSLVVSDVREVARPGVDELRGGSCSREASERLGSGGVFTSPQRSFWDLTASGAGPQESSERKAQSPVEGGARLGVGRARKT